MTEVQELVARLRLDDKMSGPIRKVRAGISGVADALNSPRMRTGIQQIGTGLRNAGRIAAVGIAAIGTQIVAGLGHLAELEKQTIATNTVIASTKGVAGISADAVRKLAEKYENLNAIIDDKVIQSTENMLLTFTNVRKDAFEPALKAILDMNTAMGGGPEGLQKNAILVGKALNNPTKGLTALTRVGVTFTAQQIKRIKTLQKEGKLYEAQKIILGELATEFGGRFAAEGQTAEAAVAGIGDAVEDLQKSLATALFPTIQKLLPKVREFLTNPQFQKGAEDLGKAIAGVFTDQNIAAAGAIIKDVFQTAQAAAPVVVAAAKTMAGIVSTAVNVFRSLPPEIQKLAIGAFAINKLTGGLVTNIAGGLISSVLKQLVSGVVNVNGAVVNVNGGVGAGGAAAATGGGLKGLLASLGLLVGLDAALAGLAGANGAQGQAKADAFGVSLPGGRVEKDLQEIIRLQREANGTLLPGQKTTEGLQRQTNAQLLLNNDRDEQRVAGQKANAIANAEGIKQEERAAAFKNVSAAASIKAAVDAEKAATVAAQFQTQQAIHNKDLSVTVPVTLTSNVTIRDTIHTQTTYKRYGGGYVS